MSIRRLYYTAKRYSMILWVFAAVLLVGALVGTLGESSPEPPLTGIVACVEEDGSAPADIAAGECYWDGGANGRGDKYILITR